MGLKQQLALVSVLTLILPWAGFQYAREMEAALRSAQEDNLLDGARSVAQLLQERPELLGDEAWGSRQQDLFAHAQSSEIVLDGFADDWNVPLSALRSYPISGSDDGFAVSAFASSDPGNAYLFVAVGDDDVRYLRPSAGPVHDQVLLRLGDPPRTLTIETTAPGPVFPRTANGEFEQRIQGNWQAVADGYQVELRIPLALTAGRLGFSVLDGDGMPADPPPHAGSLHPQGSDAGRLVRPLADLNDTLRDFTRTGRRLQVSDPHGWPLAVSGSLAVPSRPDSGGLAAPLFRLLLGDSLPQLRRESSAGYVDSGDFRRAIRGERAAFWYREPLSNEARLAASVPVRVNGSVAAVVTVEQTSAAVLTLTNRALTRLVTLTVIATMVAASGLLGFATLLSWRIRKLRNAAETALSREGELRTNLPGSRARDEIGDLSRSFAGLLDQLREYTEYLRSLSGKLSHELRTPITVVQSSLQNLESLPLDEQAAVYARRASEGTQRLSSILRAMSAASRLEESIGVAERERFDLAALVRNAGQGYQGAYPERKIRANAPAAPCPYEGAPELLMQMLDKLVENALDFTPVDGEIGLSLARAADDYVLSVHNTGPPLPEKMRERLFESLISVREQSDGVHLGLGLFIARLVVAYHNGTISADNLPDDQGVVFRIALPLRPASR